MTADEKIVKLNIGSNQYVRTAPSARGGPPWGTVWWYFRNWRDDGTWERVEEALRSRVREAARPDATPSAAIIDR